MSPDHELDTPALRRERRERTVGVVLGAVITTALWMLVLIAVQSPQYLGVN
ncbi:MAG: hypothetical protein AAFR28_18150 [Pseudomonadota bacterium]